MKVLSLFLRIFLSHNDSVVIIIRLDHLYTLAFAAECIEGLGTLRMVCESATVVEAMDSFVSDWASGSRLGVDRVCRRIMERGREGGKEEKVGNGSMATKGNRCHLWGVKSPLGNSRPKYHPMSFHHASSQANCCSTSRSCPGGIGGRRTSRQKRELIKLYNVEHESKLFVNDGRLLSLRYFGILTGLVGLRRIYSSSPSRCKIRFTLNNRNDEL